MGLPLETSIPVLTVFLQGLLSFFLPHVLPLVPLYASYLAGDTRDVDSDGNIRYPKGRALVNTPFSVVGISFTFLLPGFDFTALGSFSRNNQIWFARINGIIIVLFDLHRFGVLGRSGALGRECQLPFRLGWWVMDPLMTLVLGFTFSFAWMPYVGPMLGNVLLMASLADSATRGFLLIAVYTLGFVVPLLAVGLFTEVVLSFFRHRQRAVRYTVKVGTVLLVLMDIMTLTGFMNGITSYLSSAADSGMAETPQARASGTPAPTSGGSTLIGSEESPTVSGRSVIPAPDFTLVDQYGEEYTLSDYKGKTVSPNFWATRCDPCKREMPEVQILYEKYGDNEEDVIVLGAVNLRSEGYPYHQDITRPEVEQFLEDDGYTFPVVMDVTGEVFYFYGISTLPTTFMIGADGNVFGYVPGVLTSDMMESIVQQTIGGVGVGA